ncbi:hypothetical protein AMAG_20329 [Allomyces macrogynus ATCC 38327]|uniref:SCP2 domain-containing protein n=1 Tax=Allomyces macrogynus (strain ATCC 38327) TaxID=578462 RepID=A0A0L0T998_ALLM3|nr:hypothetical protein AMAG_20329 [Allomyces macrogynus ATCC 38327]|eukprot:KNE71290.1 hypothetical protein AMAG_20329 [Allomyces macrogynus ATCC 38327]
MTATVLPPEMVEALKPEYVAPLVAFLAHESNSCSGGIFECGSGWAAAVRWQRSGGFGFPHNKPLTPEAIAAQWSAITNFDDGRATYPTSAAESFQTLYANIQNTEAADAKAAAAAKKGGKKQAVPIDVEKAIKATFPSSQFAYTERDVILYALGVGATRKDLPWVYENSEQFHALPSFGIITGFAAMNAVPFGDFLPEFNPMMLLHGEQYLELKKPIPTSGTGIHDQSTMTTPRRFRHSTIPPLRVVAALLLAISTILLATTPIPSTAAAPNDLSNAIASFAAAHPDAAAAAENAVSKATTALATVPGAKPQAYLFGFTDTCTTRAADAVTALGPKLAKFNVTVEWGYDIHGVRGVKVAYTGPALPPVSVLQAAGNEICYNEGSLFIRGLGGWGGRKDGADARAPDASVTEKTSEDQAALYRLSGDLNPLHIDPQMSAMGGFDVPILHGLCTLGVSAKHVYNHYAGGDPAAVKSIKGRFAKHVFPGETLRTDMWREGNKVLFQVTVVERNVVAVANAAVEFHKIAGGAAAAAAPAAAASPAKASSGVIVDGFKASAVFQQLAASMAAQNSAARTAQVGKVKAVFQFDVKNGAGSVQTWHLDLKNGEGSLGVGAAKGKADATIAIGDDDLVSLAMGKTNGQKLFQTGKLKIKGQMMLAMKLDGIFKGAGKQSKM